MKQPLSTIKIYRQLLDSDLKTELATASLLTQYKNYLLAAKYKGIIMSTSIPRFLLYISTIEKFHFEKMRYYYILCRRNFHKCVSGQHLEDLEKIQYQVEVALESMKDLLPNALPYNTSLVQIYMDDLLHSLFNKKKIFMTWSAPPAEPWISPSIRSLYRT